MFKMILNYIYIVGKYEVFICSVIMLIYFCIMYDWRPYLLNWFWHKIYITKIDVLLNQPKIYLYSNWKVFS